MYPAAMIHRRTFLIGLGAALSAPAVVKADGLMRLRQTFPILWGDGVHDDAEALEAALNGRGARWRGRLLVPGAPVEIADGRFKLSRMIWLRDGANGNVLRNSPLFGPNNKSGCIRSSSYADRDLFADRLPPYSTPMM